MRKNRLLLRVEHVPINPNSPFQLPFLAPSSVLVRRVSWTASRTSTTTLANRDGGEQDDGEGGKMAGTWA